MRTIFVLFDSLNRSALGCYGGSISTPNFNRFASRCAVFDNHFVGSMPCMPARRDMHTGRLNFLHRSWGPLEPFDDSFVINLRKNNIYTHLTSDHNHYFEDGGATYHNRYNSYDFIRGQESDPWVAMVKPPLEKLKTLYHERQFGGNRAPQRIQGMLNETKFKADADFPLHKCFDAAIDFLEVNAKEDNWFLQLECFDPHEPFCVPESFRKQFQTDYKGPIYTWPQYRNSSDDSSDEIAEIKANYGALVAFCDQQLGRLIDYIDANRMWDDTAIIITTDHGFMLGEHDWWGKLRMPFFNEIAQIPLMIHDPARPKSWGTRIKKLTQVIDLSPTILDIFRYRSCEYSTGKSMLRLLEDPDASIRDIALYGVFGGALNCTDGRYTYFVYPENIEEPNLFEYTLMPMHSTSMFEVRELKNAELFKGFNFTKGAPMLKIPALMDAKRPPMQGGGFAETRTCLYDLKNDLQQNEPFRSQAIEKNLIAKIIEEMTLNNSPDELFHRFKLQN